MRKVTAITIFQTAAGCRMSIVYSEVNEKGIITRDNVRVDRILVDKDACSSAAELMDYAQSIIDGLEG